MVAVRFFCALGASIFLTISLGAFGGPGSSPRIQQANRGHAKTQGEGPDCLFLNQGRFQVRARYHDGDMTYSDAGAVSLEDVTGFDETGYFWFEDPDNVDLIVRVLDGCDFNDRFWVFSGSLTKVSYELTVTDTVTDTVKVYTNPEFELGAPIQDTDAFATCPSLPFPAPRGITENVGNKREEELFLQQDRFRLEIDWAIPGSGTGKGKVGFGTSTSGSFYFLDPSDLNVFVKILDGRPVNGHFWLGFTSFTGAEYTLTVTDTQTGITKSYDNPLGGSTYGFDHFLEAPSQGGILYPWVSNNDNFESTVVLRNNNCLPAEVTLEAQRETGDPAIVSRSVPAMGFLEESAADLFPGLGKGPGYSLFIDTEALGLNGVWVTSNRVTDSPSQGTAIEIPNLVSSPLPPNAAVGKALSFSYLPLGGDFFSAPVVVNVGDRNTDLELYFFDTQGSLIQRDLETGRDLPPHRPLARLTQDLVPGASGNLSMIAYSRNSILAGALFVFNSDGEPSIGNATAIEFVPPN